MKRKAPSCRGPMNQHQSISKSKQKQKRNQTNFKNNAVAFFVLLCLTTSTTTTHALEPTADEQTNTNTNTNKNMNMNMNIPTSFQPSNYNSPKNENHLGPIDDSTCHVEQLEEANDSQLFAILHDLKNTAFFRTFAVDLDAKCPLKWNKDQKDQKGKEPKDNSGASGSENGNGKSSFNTETKSKNKATDKGSFGTSSSGKSSPFNTHKPGPNFLGGFGSGGDTDADDGKCAGGLEEQDPDDKVSACHVDLGGESPSIPFSLPVPVPVPEIKSTETKSKNKATDKTTDKTATKTTTATTTTTAEEELDFECDGGSVAEEVEDDAPPLCELTESEMTEYYENAESKTQSKTPLQDMLYSALDSLNFNKLDFNSESEYKSQLKTFMWSKNTDPVVISHKSEEACEDDFNAVEGRLPDTFWLDMCAHIKEGEGIKMVDLTLNPERNTGYNGTHIWNAIYGENCIDMIDGYGSVHEPMCYEERFLYRLLSGLHASTTLSIAKNYYPPNKRKGRKNWEPNALYFYEQFGDHPEYIRNLHFSYVVLLRALKKAYPILNKYEIRTGNIVEDETAMILLRRLLDSSILKSCSGVFSAFDETLMFRKQDEVETTSASKFKSAAQSKFPKDEVVTIQQNFKGVFHNISSILDCVQCQQCKLHGKMAMLGYGTALKILFMTNEELIHKSLNRNEIVAFMNTIAKMSEALKDVRELTNLYWVEHVDKKKVPVPVEPPTVAVGDGVGVGAPTASDNPLDAAIGATATLASLGMIGAEREAELVKLALERDEGILALAKHYASNLDKFLMLSQSIGSVVELSPPDAIIVGTGLAGLAAALTILDRGGKVLIVEKEHRLGGNSNKASSGINACCTNHSSSTDCAESFIADTTKSAGDSAQPELISTLVGNSAKAVTWLKERVGVDLSLVAQLGGHSHKRTHRPKNGMVGAEVIYGMQRAVKEYEKSGRVEILTDTKVINLLKDDKGSVVGLEVEYLSTEKRDNPKEFYSPNVILATGGFAADRTDESYLSKYRPELVKMPATAGSFSTGDGIGLATAVGAELVDMDKVQIHPTGWVDPKDPSNPNKVLSAELMRGVGGILINNEGKRFCNELGTRAYVSNSILSHDSFFKENGVWDKSNEIPTVSLVLSSSAAADGKKHVDHYVHKGLLTKFEGLRALAEWMGQDIDVLRATLEQYRSDASNGSDEWGKTSFQGKPGDDINNEVFYAGMITPVLHYCMGGITIDNEGNVLDENRNPISGLHAAGEVTGGVHGINRLGGNSLLECTVYGTIVGNKIPIRKSIDIPRQVDFTDLPTPKKLEEISQTLLEQHSSEDDCWVAIHGYVYDLASFAEEHPAGAESIFKLCGSDGTEAFQSVHNKQMMDDFEEDKVGIVS